MADGIDYQKEYESVKRKIFDLTIQRMEIEKQILKERQSLHSLEVLCKNTGRGIFLSGEANKLLEHSGLSDEIRKIIRASGKIEMRLREVEKFLFQLGFDMVRYNNPKSAIQTALKRMAKTGEIVEVEVPPNGRKAYRLAQLPGDVVAYTRRENRKIKSRK